MVESDSMLRATELLDLVRSPTALATGVLLAYAKAQIEKNEGGIEPMRTFWAVIASLLALVVVATLVVIMAPLALRVALLNPGGEVETRLVVYCLAFLVAIGTAGYSADVLGRSLEDLKLVSSGSKTLRVLSRLGPRLRVSKRVERLFESRLS